MYLSFLLVSILWSLVTVAYPSDWKHVIHERRQVKPEGWIRHSRMHLERILPMRIALKQSEIHNLDSHLMRISTPDSNDYGKHWSYEKIVDTFAPSQDTIREVHEWLLAAGIARGRIKKSRSPGWLHFNVTVEEAEILLRTEYHLYEHEVTGQGHVACDAYNVPRHVQSHIDFITPTIHFDTKIVPRFDHRTRERKRSGTGFGPWGKPWLPKASPVANPTLNNLQDCSNNVTPDCLRALYGIPTLPPTMRTNPGNSFGVVEYTPQSYMGSDLDKFFSNYSKNPVELYSSAPSVLECPSTPVQKRPTLLSVDGGNIHNTPNLNQNTESNLDLQYAMALVNPLNVTLYQVGDLVQTEYTSFNNFLDSIDGSYCSDNDSTDNVTSPTVDAIYPDPLPGGYAGPRNCGGHAATKVISTSYSYNEHDLSPAYETRQCNEYAKLGLLGTTFLYCSSDFGVAGSQGRCLDPSTSSYNDGLSGMFIPSFPSTCPYVLSIGATQIKPNASVTEPEIACATKIASGGGFSNVFPMPSYQSQALKSWFKNYPPPYEAGRFNNSQQMRGYPDVSANGAKYVVALLGGYNYHLYGTSASAPTFGAVITLINEARLNVGKGPVGFINPTLYAHPYLLNDITNGSNPGCGTAGFSSAPGWDPVTGLGTPNYPRMLQYFLTH
ncbi:related to tripeptidyl-peptidase I [Phialocephala subalpina]|uniref:Related to tripeptidyl-peptidase I n=1 Tax=Phialocephala subalpina TaxID=576137 RepID=A0A1L7WYN3_9HELO|nr:related to tripeptidyl-peptidase I [Phialocephala subalpina]